MAYIGKSPSTKFSAAAKVDTFTGDGSTTTFDLANIIPAGGENGLQVFVNNVRQKPGASNAFTVGNDGSGDLKRITFTEAPAASDEIYVITTFEATNITEVGDGTIATAKLADDAVTSAKIADGVIVNADINASAAIADSKLATLTTASKVNVSALSAPGSSSVFLRGDRTYGAIPTDDIDTNAFNISLLGFKMAVNEGLTVFNLVDGIVDEFHDESGTDEAEGSNDTYNATSDFYINSSSQCGTASPATSAGFAVASVTEADTSTAGSNPSQGTVCDATFTVPSGVTSVTLKAWGAGGGGGRAGADMSEATGGGGGFASGTFAVTSGQVLHVSVGEGAQSCGTNPQTSGGRRGGNGFGGAAGGGGLTAVNTGSELSPSRSADMAPVAPTVAIVAGSGGGGAGNQPTPGSHNIYGGAGGGTGGDTAGYTVEQTNAQNLGGGGGDQEQGGQSNDGQNGGLLLGANSCNGGSYADGGGGGSGYYGGGSGKGSPSPIAGGHGGGGGGSSYFGHPQITSGATEEGAAAEGGGTGDPDYQAGTNEGAANPGSNPNTANYGEDGYVLISASAVCATTLSTTIVSNAFTASSVPTTSRIVVFEENVATPTLNTDIIASISRDGGSNFTTATLSDSGYVTGSSGQRILTGQATISGQPSGQSMRWKLALANNAVKIHGVSLQWS